MSAPDPLAVIEGTNTIADLVDGFKQALVERGWSEPSAEHAAVVVYQVERLKG